MGKKIVICFDGTWNTPDVKPGTDGDDSTNVWKLYDAVSPQDASRNKQVKWYDEGVGTHWYDKLLGGAFGVGLSGKIKDGYQKLIELYEEGDDVYIFGFSRGAYSARSLVGLIRNSGLLKPEYIDHISDAYQIYRIRDSSADSENAKLFRQSFSRNISIHCLGVWDTVGALGIPLESFNWFNKEYYEFHDTELSSIVRNAFHAVAVDEWRKNYQCTLWEPKYKPNQILEQVWFPGAHANVGGGYEDNHLSDIPLIWMMDKASRCGLELIKSKIPSIPSPPPAPLVNSYSDFLGGAYSQLEKPYFRPIGVTLYGQESLDPTTSQRISNDRTYKPKNLIGPYLIGHYTPVGRMY